MTWFLPSPHADHYEHPDGRRWPRVSTVVGEWQRCAMPGTIPAHVLDEAARLGTCVHAWVAFLFGHPSDDLPAISERSRLRAGHAMVAFAEWVKAYNPQPLHVEKRLHCEEDRVVGTADWVGVIKGQDGPGVIDWKTSNELHMGGRIALAKYVDMVRRDGTEVTWAALVRLSKDLEAAPAYEMRVFTLDDLRDDLEAFRHLRALHDLARVKEAA